MGSQLDRIERKLNLLLKNEGIVMSDLDDLKASEAKLATDQAAEDVDIKAALAAGAAAAVTAAAAIADLKAQIAALNAAGAATPADLQALTQAINATDAAVNTMDAAVKAATT